MDFPTLLYWEFEQKDKDLVDDSEKEILKHLGFTKLSQLVSRVSHLCWGDITD